MGYNRKKLFAFFPSEEQKKGIHEILLAWDASKANDNGWLAYILATAYHETGAKLQPVREGFAQSNEEAIAIVTKLFAKKKIRRNYALPHDNGHSYYGRGYVQLTHGYNYQSMGLRINQPLYDHPDLVLNPFISATILVTGMIEGLFTGKKLAEYINERKKDFVNARKIINGLDCADKIAVMANSFDSLLNAEDDK